jgi:hypothetical protein
MASYAPQSTYSALSIDIVSPSPISETIYTPASPPKHHHLSDLALTVIEKLEKLDAPFRNEGFAVEWNSATKAWERMDAHEIAERLNRNLAVLDSDTPPQSAEKEETRKVFRRIRYPLPGKIDESDSLEFFSKMRKATFKAFCGYHEQAHERHPTPKEFLIITENFLDGTFGMAHNYLTLFV